MFSFEFVHFSVTTAQYNKRGLFDFQERSLLKQFRAAILLGKPWLTFEYNFYLETINVMTFTIMLWHLSWLLFAEFCPLVLIPMFMESLRQH